MTSDLLIVTNADTRCIFHRRRPLSPRIRLRSATSINYSVPRTRTKFGDRAFSVAGPVVWNSILAAVREADTAVSSFKRKLKTHFFLCALTMLDFDFYNALPAVRARVGRGTITAIYYYYVLLLLLLSPRLGGRTVANSSLFPFPLPSVSSLSSP